MVEIVIGAWRETFRTVRGCSMGDTAFTIVGIVHEEILSLAVDEISTSLRVVLCFIRQFITSSITRFSLLQEKHRSIISGSSARGAKRWCRLVVDLVEIIVW